MPSYMWRRRWPSLGRLRVLVAVLALALVGVLVSPGTVLAITFLPRTDYATGSNALGLALADLNGDGKPDLAVATQGGMVSVLLNTGSGNFSAKADFAAGTNPSAVAVADFNGDLKPDLAVANTGSGNVSVLLGNGDGTFAARTDYAVGTNPSGVAVGDFNGDGFQDLAVTNGGACIGSGTVSILRGVGNGTFLAKTDFTVGACPSDVVVGDFNGDGKRDLAVTNSQSSTVSILLGDGLGSFGAKTDFTVGMNPSAVAIGDFNGDGKPDHAVTNSGSGTVSVLLGTTPGNFSAKTDYAVGTNPSSVAVADMDGDGKLDLVVANPNSNTVSILLGKGDGTFLPKTDLTAVMMPMGGSIALGARDLSGDGKPDIAVSDGVANKVSVFIQGAPVASVGGVAEQPDIALTSTVNQPRSNPDKLPMYTLVVGGAALVAGAVGAAWSARKRRTA